MTVAAGAEPRRRSWWLFLLALFAYVAFGYIPAGPAFTPVGPAFLLVGATVVACVLTALALHGRFAVAPLAVAFAGMVLTASMPGASESYRLLVLGWSVILAASFGLLSIIAPSQPFLPRALATVALALTIGVVGAGLLGQGVEKVKATLYTEAARRSDMLDLRGQRYFSAANWRDAAAQRPQLTALRVAYDEWVHALPQHTLFFLPSLLALQSLAALALGWELFHRLSRQAVGPPLAPLREFTFNDQLVWGVAVGLTILVLPEFVEGRAAAANILAFFAVLFALRGLGVLVSFKPGRVLVPIIILLLVVAWPIAIVLALALGLADIWLDVRRRATLTR